MKRSLLTAIMAVFCLTTVNAQGEGDIEIGGGFGVNFSVVRAGSENATDSKVGFNLGGSGEYYFSDRWGIKGKLIFDQKGWGNGYMYNEDTDESFTTDYNLNYLSIPVMANWHFGSTRKWYLNFGAYAGVLLSAETKEGGIDVKEAFNSVDFGLAAGIGYKFPINDNTKLYIEYDEQYGLSNIFKNNEGTSAQNSRSSFNLGVLFTL